MNFAVLQSEVRNWSTNDQRDLQVILTSVSIRADGVATVNAVRVANSIGVLARLAAFGNNHMKVIAHRLAWEIARALGIYPASIDALYRQIGRGEISGFSVPAVNMRAIAFQSARGVFSAMRELNVGAAIFELSRGEIGFTNQRPHEYATVILCAAIAEGHTGPVFLQGDHFQVSKSRYSEDPEVELAAVEALIAESISAGFYNIDIDTSTLVDLSHGNVNEQQKPNYTLSARLANFTRHMEPDGITISLGGEIGEVGEDNSTMEELIAYLNGFVANTPKTQPGLTKLSIQSGTRHGGNVVFDGSFGDMPIDFNLISLLSARCRDAYDMGGCVQHGASMLTLEKISRLADVGCIEVHLAAAFLNAVYDNLPSEMVRHADDWAKENFAEEWKSNWSQAQFLHHARRYPIRYFKKEWWQATDSHKGIRDAVHIAASNYFRALRVENSRALVANTITHTPVKWSPTVLNLNIPKNDESDIQGLAS